LGSSKIVSIVGKTGLVEKGSGPFWVPRAAPSARRELATRIPKAFHEQRKTKQEKGSVPMMMVGESDFMSRKIKK
jgi:hypothetical protein